MFVLIRDIKEGVFVERDGVIIHDNDLVEDGDILETTSNTQRFGDVVYTLHAIGDDNNLINITNSTMDVEKGTSVGKKNRINIDPDLNTVSLGNDFATKDETDYVILQNQREAEFERGIKFEFEGKMYIGIAGQQTKDIIYVGSGTFSGEALALVCNRRQFPLGVSPIEVDKTITLRGNKWLVDSIDIGRVTLTYNLLDTDDNK